jgi:hypothetical protein
MRAEATEVHWLTCNPTLRALEQQRQLLAGGGQPRPVDRPEASVRREVKRPLPTPEERAAMAVLDTQAPLPPAGR